MKFFTTVLFLCAFLVLIGMPEKILAQRRTTTPLPPPGPHEEFWACGSSCYNSCDRPRAADGPCNRMCIRGNFCVDGYVRESQSGPCILPSECPRTSRAYRLHMQGYRWTD